MEACLKHVKIIPMHFYKVDDGGGGVKLIK